MTTQIARLLPTAEHPHGCYGGCLFLSIVERNALAEEERVIHVPGRRCGEED